MTEDNLLGLSDQFWLLFGQFELLLSSAFYAMAILIGIKKRRSIINWVKAFDGRPKGTNAIDKQIADSISECDHLIILFSRADQMRWLVDQVQPVSVDILVGGDGDFKENAMNFANELNQNNIQSQVHFIKVVDQTLDTKIQVSSIIERLKTHGQNKMLIDITGGTTVMSIGALDAARADQIPVSYVSMPFVRAGKPDITKSKITRVF